MESFYYCGIGILSTNADVYSPWTVDRINTIRESIEAEAGIRDLLTEKKDFQLILIERFNEYELICEYDGNRELKLGIYDSENNQFIEPKTSDITSISDGKIKHIARMAMRIGMAIYRGEIDNKYTKLSNDIEVLWKNRKEFLKDNHCVYHTNDLDYIIKRENHLHTDDELKHSLPDEKPHYKLTDEYGR